MTTHGLLFLRIVTGFPVLFTSAVTREKLFFASASPIVSVDITAPFNFSHNYGQNLGSDQDRRRRGPRAHRHRGPVAGRIIPRLTPGRSSHPAPTSLSHPRNRSPGPDPTQVEGRTRRLLRYRRSQQRLHGSHQRTLSSWADAPPEATATPPATNSECSSSQEV